MKPSPACRRRNVPVVPVLFSAVLLLALAFPGFAQPSSTPQGVVERFEFESSGIDLQRPAQGGDAFDKVGRRFAVLGEEGGSFEAWAWPVKLFRNAQFSFLLGESTRPLRGEELVRYVTVRPAVTTLTYVYQSFSVKAHFVASIDQPGALVLLEVESTQPLKIVVGFQPVLQPMWPAGIGGQWSYWHEETGAYVIGASSQKARGIFGSPLGQGLSYTPAHMLADSPSEFVIAIEDPQAVSEQFIPVAMAGGDGEWEETKAVYNALLADPRGVYQRAHEHYAELLESTMSIDTPDDELDLAFQWAKIAYDNLVVHSPAFDGPGLVAGLARSGTSGRPGFGWYFGGDTYINSLSLNALGAYDITRDVLAFMRPFQREDGKMAHEITQAVQYVDWWGDYHYGYIHGDTTPYYILAVGDLVRRTGDLEFLRQSWPSVLKGWDWCLATDEDGDGLMDNSAAGLGALEYGELTGGIQTDVYIGGIWVQATRAMESMARLLLNQGEGGLDRGQVSAISATRERAEESFNRRFWDRSRDFYAYAFSPEGDHIQETSPWNCVAFTFDVGEEQHIRTSLRRMIGASLLTDWGVRSISRESEHFSPLNYNYGAVWPFLNSWISCALFRHGYPQQGLSVLKATASQTFQGQLGAIHEVFSGSLHAWPQESVSHQGFSTAGAVLPTVRGLLGLDSSADTLVFSPRFPADWERAEVANHRLGATRFDITWQREGEEQIVVIRPDRCRSIVGLVEIPLPPDPTWEGRLDGAQLLDRQLLQGEAGTVVRYVFRMMGDDPVQLAVRSNPAVEVLPVLPETRLGETNRGLKLLSITRTKQSLRILVEGLAGRDYRLGITHPELVSAIGGGSWTEEQEVLVTVPPSRDGGFVTHEVTLHLLD